MDKNKKQRLIEEWAQLQREHNSPNESIEVKLMIQSEMLGYLMGATDLRLEGMTWDENSHFVEWLIDKGINPFEADFKKVVKKYVKTYEYEV